MTVIDFAQAKRERQEQLCPLAREIAVTLPAGMTLPEPLTLLFRWIEASGFCRQGRTGRTGYLCPPEVLHAPMIGNERCGGTYVIFGPQDPLDLKYWFGSENPEIFARLCIIAEINGDGSRVALWQADDGSQKLVLVGSGSGCGLVCVLADDPVDFLRLLAIGYDEIYEAELAHPPNTGSDYITHPNLAFGGWVERTFGVTIPTRGCEIVRHPAWMHADASPDPFWQWVKRMSGSPPLFED